jgi:hypothetical protein
MFVIGFSLAVYTARSESSLSRFVLLFILSFIAFQICVGLIAMGLARANDKSSRNNGDKQSAHRGAISAENIGKTGEYYQDMPDVKVPAKYEPKNADEFGAFDEAMAKFMSVPYREVQ